MSLSVSNAGYLFTAVSGPWALTDMTMLRRALHVPAHYSCREACEEALGSANKSKPLCGRAVFAYLSINMVFYPPA